MSPRESVAKGGGHRDDLGNRSIWISEIRLWKLVCEISGSRLLRETVLTSKT